MTKSNISVNLSEEVINAEETKKPSVTNVSRNRTSAGTTVQPDNVELVEDIFGVYYDENGSAHNIKRYTWKSKNKIQVQVINYGARITSMKMPDRKGNIDDIVLGFDDIAGYIYNKDKYFGATIGRMSNVVKNGTFHVNNKQYWLTLNHNSHHYNGGRMGLDQVVWTTFMDDKRVIMSYVSPDMSEGYPGDLLIRIIFELSARNEFSIRMEAQCTQPTIVNLSNLTYFNLGGHHSGSNEIYKHILTLNCNCFTPQSDGIPNGVIMNVVHSEFDFQIPKILGKAMGIVPKDGFNQNLCINRGMDQADCFVARVLHPPSGRLLEVYSNQWGVQLYTANDFGFEEIMSTEQLMNTPTNTPRKCVGSEPLLKLYEKVYQEIRCSLSKDSENTFKDVYNLIKKIREFDDADVPTEPANEVNKEEFFRKHTSLTQNDFIFTELQIEYLTSIFKVLCDKCDEDPCEELQEIVKTILSLAKTKEQIEKIEESRKAEGESDKGDNQEDREDKVSKKKSVSSTTKRKSIKKNSIPEYYRSSNKIIGKERAHYKTHGGMALQTQNYPACANYKNFPNCVLKPGETYVHTITYKFWIRAGDPNKWIKRNSNRL